jgi:hypothetical protein
MRPAWTVQFGRMAASIAIAVALGYSAVAASAASLPDSPLYQVKLVVQDVLIAVAPPEQKPRLAVEQLEVRLGDAQAMVDVGRTQEAGRAVKAAARSIEYAEALAPQSSSPQEVRAAIKSSVEKHSGAMENFRQQGGDTPPVLSREVAAVPERAAPAAPPSSVAAPPAPAAEPADTPADVTSAFGAPVRGFETLPLNRAGGVPGGGGVENNMSRPSASAGSAAAPSGAFAPLPGSDAQRPAAPPASFVPVGGDSQPAAAAPAAPLSPAGTGDAAQTVPPPPAAFAPVGNGGATAAGPASASPAAAASATAANPSSPASTVGGVEAPTGGFRSIPGGLPSPNRTAHDSQRSSTSQ